MFPRWYPHPELNRDQRFRKPPLYPFELWGLPHARDYRQAARPATRFTGSDRVPGVPVSDVAERTPKPIGSSQPVFPSLACDPNPRPEQRASVLECASPLALWDARACKRGKSVRGLSSFPGEYPSEQPDPERAQSGLASNLFMDRRPLFRMRARHSLPATGWSMGRSEYNARWWAWTTRRSRVTHPGAPLLLPKVLPASGASSGNRWHHNQTRQCD